MLNAKVRHFLKRLTAVTLLTLAALVLLVYGLDYIVFRYRLRSGGGFGQVTVTGYDAIPQKSGKTLFMFHDPQQQTCVNSLFPRAGYVPCWYLRRHSDQATNF
ncbi:MAG: hypothetical protein WAL56_24575 [Candidatus Sulfotelmatobacter sp.]